MINKKLNKKEILEKIGFYARIAGRIAELAVLIRGKPSYKDLVLLGAAGIDIALQVGKEKEKQKKINPWSYFEDDWENFPSGLTSTIFKHVVNIAPAPVQSTKEDTLVYFGSLENEQVGWYTSNSPAETPYRLYFRLNRHDETMKALAKVIWKDFKTNYLIYDSKELRELFATDNKVINTAFIQQTFLRAEKFINSNITRGYLLEGPPGSGKTTCIQELTKRLNLKTIHITTTSIRHFFDYGSTQPSIETIVKILKPDAIVIDDVDRIEEENQTELLGLLERIRANCKIVFVSVNNKTDLMDAILRPGRLDDHIQAPNLEKETILEIIGEEDKDLAEQMGNWPIAYVVDYKERKNILGREMARKEFKLLNDRILEQEKRTSEDE